jgi:hypothetical protein
LKTLFIPGLHNVFLLIGVIGLLLCIESTYGAFFYDYEFRIISVEKICEQPLNNRCFNQYFIENKNKIKDKIIINSDIFRQNDLLPGNKIKKDKFTFSYYVNEKKMVWGDITYILNLQFFSLLMFVLWRYLNNSKRKAN